MGETVTWAIEAAVGAACLLGVVPLWRTERLRWLAAVLALAGCAAIVHAALGLLD
jgi:hypothetical protein